MISIIIPVYNQADKISKCLDSILNQSYKDFEVIVVNDGSNDNLESRIKNYELRIRNFKYIVQDNQGSNPARNRGAQEAKGEYVIFCDADVVMQPEMLETMLNTLEANPEASFAYSAFFWGKKLFPLWAYDERKLREMPYIHTTSLIKREHFPGFDDNIRRLQDWDLWLTMLEQGHKGVWISKTLFKVETGGTISNWLPKCAYEFLPFLPQVKKYNEAMSIIKKKHNLSPLDKGGKGGLRV